MRFITKQWLTERDAWDHHRAKLVERHDLIDHPADEVIEGLIEAGECDIAAWVLLYLLNQRQRIELTIFAAKDVLPMFEAVFPNDTRPRDAIASADACLISNTEDNRAAAQVAASAVWDSRAKAALTENFTLTSAADAARGAAEIAIRDIYTDYTAYANHARDGKGYPKYLAYGLELLRSGEDLPKD